MHNGRYVVKSGYWVALKSCKGTLGGDVVDPLVL